MLALLVQRYPPPTFPTTKDKNKRPAPQPPGRKTGHCKFLKFNYLSPTAPACSTPVGRWSSTGTPGSPGLQKCQPRRRADQDLRYGFRLLRFFQNGTPQSRPTTHKSHIAFHPRVFSTARVAR